MYLICKRAKSESLLYILTVIHCIVPTTTDNPWISKQKPKSSVLFERIYQNDYDIGET